MVMAKFILERAATVFSSRDMSSLELCAKTTSNNMAILPTVWVIGEVMIGLLYYWYNEWFNYLILFLVIPIVGLLIFRSFFLIESPLFKRKKMSKGTQNDGTSRFDQHGKDD